jgi:signal transduction histidine kinase
MSSDHTSSRDASSEAPRVRPLPSRAHRARVLDALSMVIYGGLAIGLAVLSLEPPHATPLWSMAALGIGGIAVMATRHRYPRLAFAGALVLAVISSAVGSGAEWMLALTALYLEVARRTGWAAWLYVGASLACGAIGAMALSLRGIGLPPILGLAPRTLARDAVLDWANTFSIIAVALVIAALVGSNVGHRRRYIDELVDRAERLARERDQQVEIARALERERIAREMHDVIAHSLSVMIAVSDGAHAVSDERPAAAKEAIARVAETGRRTLGEVRRLLGGVRGDHGNTAAQHAPQPDASQLPSLVTEFQSAGLPVSLVMEGIPSVDAAVGLTVYRIVQESLTNVLRHGQRTRSVSVTVAWTAEEVTILVRDVGPIVSASAHTGRGLLGMRERVALYDGTIEAGPHKDGGWRVIARLHWGEHQL